MDCNEISIPSSSRTMEADLLKAEVAVAVLTTSEAAKASLTLGRKSSCLAGMVFRWMVGKRKGTREDENLHNCTISLWMGISTG